MTGVQLSGPAFVSTDCEYYRLKRSDNNGRGVHYSVFEIDKYKGVEYLKMCFPNGEVENETFCLFSTSGVHGSRRTIEEAETLLRKNPDREQILTVLILSPRIVATFYGDIVITLEDVFFLKLLRRNSLEAMRRWYGEEKT